MNTESSTYSQSNLRIDYATLIGIAGAFFLVLMAIDAEGGLESFLDARSAMIVLGGTLGAALVSFSLEDFARTLSLLRTAFLPDHTSGPARIERILEATRKFRAERKERMIDVAEEEPDDFFRKGLVLLSEGQSAQEIRRIMEIELECSEDRHRRGAQLFSTMGNIAPAMGLIGTLIGLVQMLQKIDNPSDIGPAMSIALLTTFYGTVLAQLICFPIASKLRARSQEEYLLKELTIEGVAATAEGINPRTIELRLLGFLRPTERRSQYE